MDIVKILDTIRAKGLDEAHFELLQQTYELLNQNIRQTQSTNAALRGSNAFLKENIERLEDELRKLRQYIFEIESGSASPEPAKGTQELQEFSDVAEDILKVCLQQTKTEFSGEEMVQALPYSREQIDAALVELGESEIVKNGSVDTEDHRCCLTLVGKNYALTLDDGDND
jgi:predicted nuclease with TOPRIM domain